MQVFLIGMMGSGKTTIAKAICKYIQASFIDLDDEIEKNAHKKIQEIFAQDGETVFRKLETDMLKKVSENDAIIATGGGIVERAENRIFLQSHLTIFLSGKEQALWERVQNDENRPLAQKQEIFSERYKRRQALYASCAVYTIDINEKSIGDIVAEILFIIAKEEAK